jgi:hypothetical protein
MSEITPNNTDAVLGGQNPPPVNAAVLGGEIGRKKRLQYKKSQKFWQKFEFLNDLPNRHAITFADRQVVTFEPGMEIINGENNAYAIRSEDFVPLWHSLLQSNRVNEVEALVFGLVFGCGDYNNKLNSIIANANNKLLGLKAIFLGDIEDSECMISGLPYYEDISPVLLSYENLEILYMRCNNGRNGRTGEKPPKGFSFCKPLKHNRLKVLRIESGGLSQRTLQDLNQLDLPNLEYLELWLGNEEYGGTSSIVDLMPIISGNKFPRLKYLGLRNCEYTDDIAFELAKSPILDRLIDLDLSMGTLGDDGLTALLNCPAVNELDVLNVSQNWISKDFIARILPQFQLTCEVIIDNQQCDEYVDRSNRYCVVAE